MQILKTIRTSIWKDKLLEMIDRTLISFLRTALFFQWRNNIRIESGARLRVAPHVSLKLAKTAQLIVKSGCVNIGYSEPDMRRFPVYDFSTLVVAEGGVLETSGDIYTCPGTVIAVSSNAKISLGENVLISWNSFLHAKEGISIGSDTMLSWCVSVMDNDLHNIYSCFDNSCINKSKPIHIGKNVLIGHHATILKGVSIGDGAVVGAYSVVTKDVPERVIVAGNPAKIIKENVRWER